MKNKKQNYTLSVEMKKTQQEMLSSYPNVLRTLHYSNGFNYQKPYRIYKHVGKFTINSLSKLYDIDYKRDIAVALSVYFSAWHIDYVHEQRNLSSEKLYLYELPNGDNIYSNDLYIRTGIYKSNVNDFEKKEDFNSVRKSDNSIIYIIVQEEQYRDSVEPREINKYMDCLDRYCNLSKYYHYQDYKNNLDKSGYNYEVFRRRLHSRLTAYRVEKEKEEFAKSVDVKKVYDEYINTLSKFKDIVSGELIIRCSVTDVKKINKIATILSYFERFLYWINKLNECENLTNYIGVKSACDTRVCEIKDMIKELQV